MEHAVPLLRTDSSVSFFALARSGFMAFQRRILHHGANPSAVPQLISLTALRSCWFELHRQGGCGAGELVLSDEFEFRGQIELGDWISLEVESGERWYLGRVEERTAEVPARVRLRLEGMAAELNQVFPGGFGSLADGKKPHRYAATDQFPHDPDRAEETADFVASAEDIVRLLLTQYVTAAGHIQYVPDQIEPPLQSSPVTSLKVRGEESVWSLMKDLALRAQSASWGVDANGQFYFLQPRSTLLATYQEQRDLTVLTETRDVEYLFNRLLLTGDYVYDQELASEDVARKVYRWRGNFYEPVSRGQYGDRRLKVWLPWIRTQSDSLAFAREFFRAYAQPGNRYFIETTAQTFLPRPWLGEVRLQTRAGVELARTRVETIRVLFDHAPRFRMELGPEDPRNLWPEPPQDERWELPSRNVPAGGIVSQPTPISPGDEGGGPGGLSSDTWPPFSFDSDSSDGSDGSDDPSSGSSDWSSEYSYSGSSGSHTDWHDDSEIDHSAPSGEPWWPSSQPAASEADSSSLHSSAGTISDDWLTSSSELESSDGGDDSSQPPGGGSTSQATTTDHDSSSLHTLPATTFTFGDHH